jgi:hypothetical protein
MQRRTLLFAFGSLVAVLLAAIAAVGTSERTARAYYAPAQLSTDLFFECQPDGAVRVYLQWSSSNQGLQWLDLSLFDNDFQPGTFLSAGPLPSGQGSLTWDGLVPGAWHVVRVNTLTDAGWAPSEKMLFFTPNDCTAARAGTEVPPPIPVGCIDNGLAACVTTEAGDYGAFDVGDTVFYCFAVREPGYVRVVTTKPDGSHIIVYNNFANTGACVGPYEAAVPLGLRTVDLYGGPGMQLLSETHFFVR